VTFARFFLFLSPIQLASPSSPKYARIMFPTEHELMEREVAR